MDDLNERDLFAMLAMCGMLANGAKDPNSIAMGAYAYADVMMLARQTKGENHGS
jgi:hypothetical protein